MVQLRARSGERARDPMAVYERNFRHLLSLVPGLPRLERPVALEAPGLPAIFLQVAERSRYTLCVVLHQRLGLERRGVRDPSMRVRVYWDARLAEVVAYQGHRHFRPSYPYPNPWMLQRHEKRQVNRFLGEWLGHCLGRGYRCRPAGLEV